MRNTYPLAILRITGFLLVAAYVIINPHGSEKTIVHKNNVTV